MEEGLLIFFIRQALQSAECRILAAVAAPELRPPLTFVWQLLPMLGDLTGGGPACSVVPAGQLGLSTRTLPNSQTATHPPLSGPVPCSLPPRSELLQQANRNARRVHLFRSKMQASVCGIPEGLV